MDQNEIKNQRICNKFVDRDVICCVSVLVSELLGKAEHFPDYEDDLYRLQYVDDYEVSFDNWLEYADADEITGLAIYLESEGNISGSDIEADRRIIALYSADHGDYEDLCRELDIELERAHVYEHWIVSGYLADKLEAKGERILHNFFGLTVWGRTTSGQAISMDGVIYDICSEMGILSGQVNEWEM